MSDTDVCSSVRYTIDSNEFKRLSELGADRLKVDM